MQLPENLKNLAEELGVQPASVGKGLWASVVEYTPEMAANMLNYRNPNNRRPDSGAIARLAAAMSNKQFVLSGETVIFGLDANLCDGQQRLSAVLRSQTTQPILTVFGVDQTRAFLVIDHGKGRTLADSLYLQNKSIKNVGVVASTIRSGWSLIHASGTNAAAINSSFLPTDRVLLDFYAQHPDLNEAIRFVMTSGRCAIFEPSKGFVAALLWVTRRVASDRAGTLFQNMADAALPREACYEAARKFVKRAQQPDEDGNGMDRLLYRALLIKVWNHFFLGEATENLVWYRTREDFPQIEGLAYDAAGICSDPRMKPLRNKR